MVRLPNCVCSEHYDCFPSVCLRPLSNPFCSCFPYVSKCINCNARFLFALRTQIGDWVGWVRSMVIDQIPRNLFIFNCGTNGPVSSWQILSSTQTLPIRPGPQSSEFFRVMNVKICILLVFVVGNCFGCLHQSLELTDEDDVLEIEHDDHAQEVFNVEIGREETLQDEEPTHEDYAKTVVTIYFMLYICYVMGLSERVSELIKQPAANSDSWMESFHIETGIFVRNYIIFAV
jgi:hypothetical protein